MSVLNPNDYVALLKTKTRIYLSFVPEGRRTEDQYKSELADLSNLLSEEPYLNLFSIHETGHVIYFEKAGVTDFSYIPPLVDYQLPSDKEEECFKGQWAAILPKNYIEPPNPQVDIEGLNDWLFRHAKAFAAGGVFSLKFTTTDYGGDIKDRQRFGELCAAAYDADKLIGVECMWIEAQKQVERDLENPSFIRLIETRTLDVKQRLYFPHLL